MSWDSLIYLVETYRFFLLGALFVGVVTGWMSATSSGE